MIKWIKPGSLWSITNLCWNLCEATITSHLEDDMKNKVMRSNKNEISRRAKWTVCFEELQDLRRLSGWTVKGDGKFKLKKHLVNEKIILVLYNLLMVLSRVLKNEIVTLLK